MTPFAFTTVSAQPMPLFPPASRKDNRRVARTMALAFGLMHLVPFLGGALAILLLARGLRRFHRATQRAHLRWHLDPDYRQGPLEKVRVSAPYVVERIRMRVMVFIVQQALFQVPIWYVIHAVIPPHRSGDDTLAVLWAGQLLLMLTNCGLGVGLLHGLWRERSRLLHAEGASA